MAAKANKRPSKQPGAPKGSRKPSGAHAHPLLLLGAAISLLVSVGVTLYFNEDMMAGFVATSFGSSLGVATNPATLSADELRRRLQEGRQGMRANKKCEDVPSASCSVKATKESCTADKELAQDCCRSCFNVVCLDTDPACIEWSQSGECYKNPDFMKRTCCYSCSVDPSDPCSHDPSKRPDVAEGDISRIFKRAIKEYAQYEPIVHSQDPWVVSFDNLLSDEECDGIVEAVGGKNGEYIKPSTTAKSVRDEHGRVKLTDVPDPIRTSHNAWCQHAGCYNHPIHERIITRIMGIVGLPHNNAEHMQLLKYGPGEYYKLHHDWIPEQQQALCGPRVFTFFLYLSDVEEGGGTYFPYLNITVKPRRGSAVWWAHGMDDNPWKKDDRTHHEAQPVIAGTKLAANYWIHGSDFKRAMATGCDGRSRGSKRIWRK
mmetsp:Transcript_14678/g.31056  ORF Transcript_14678/g.31056 Transcript_14678/m.31056 type:complete len:430 (+) Transcript_14678:18-1307(+)